MYTGTSCNVYIITARGSGYKSATTIVTSSAGERGRSDNGVQ